MLVGGGSRGGGGGREAHVVHARWENQQLVGECVGWSVSPRLIVSSLHAPAREAAAAREEALETPAHEAAMRRASGALCCPVCARLPTRAAPSVACDLPAASCRLLLTHHAGSCSRPRLRARFDDIIMMRSCCRAVAGPATRQMQKQLSIDMESGNLRCAPLSPQPPSPPLALHVAGASLCSATCPLPSRCATKEMTCR